MSTLFSRLIARDAGATSTTMPTPISHSTVVLLIVLLILLILALLLVAGLLIVRQRRRNSKASLLPVYDEKRFSTSSSSSSSNNTANNNHRRVMTRPSESVYVYNEKQDLIARSASPPPSPLPEIRITFPEEIDDSGKRQSGRVVVVRIGDSGIGLEPVDIDAGTGLPGYEHGENGRFHSIDLDRVGGLVEIEKTGHGTRSAAQ